MARTYEGELQASMAVLGIVIERPGETVASIAHLLGERFSYAQFASSAAYNTLPRQAAKGLVRRVGGGTGANERYEATKAGEKAFRMWLRKASLAPLAVREALHGRMEFATAADIPMLIDAIEQERKVCQRTYEKWHAKLSAAELSADRSPEAEIHAAILHDHCMIWVARVKRMQRLTALMETIAANCADEKQAADDEGKGSRGRE